jgi:hypothetical protein
MNATRTTASLKEDERVWLDERDLCSRRARKVCHSTARLSDLRVRAKERLVTLETQLNLSIRVERDSASLCLFRNRPPTYVGRHVRHMVAHISKRGTLAQPPPLPNLNRAGDLPRMSLYKGVQSEYSDTPCKQHEQLCRRSHEGMIMITPKRASSTSPDGRRVI